MSRFTSNYSSSGRGDNILIRLPLPCESPCSLFVPHTTHLISLTCLQLNDSEERMPPGYASERLTAAVSFCSVTSVSVFETDVSPAFSLSSSSLTYRAVACHLHLLLFSSCPEPRIALHFPSSTTLSTALPKPIAQASLQI
jgi:hypothetical protein